jgi:UDP-GlcNAc:undecaprenyl-phosphate GlcNAc-1-phosphate transferase
MLPNAYVIYATALLAAFLLSVVLTYAVRVFAIRWGLYDHPGERKMHAEPMPLMGGVAIFITFNIMIHGIMIVFLLSNRFGMVWIESNLLQFLGDDAKITLAGILAGAFLIFLLGVVDDIVSLTPWVKLVGQIAAAGVLVLSDMRLELFVLSEWWLYTPVTIFWVVLLTNSLNFLDNMDGLCGGVSVIAAFSFFLCVQQNDILARLLLMIFAGAVAGFLYHNLSPARIFMGDAGSMFCGYFLATIAVMGTFHIEHNSASTPIAVAAPLLALSVPLFDTASVIFLRWRSGQSIMMGDKRHFSHRLVELGMTPRQAVEFIFLVAGVAGLGGALLPMIDRGGMGAFIILAQVAGVFLLIVLLMNAGKGKGTTNHD